MADTGNKVVSDNSEMSNNLEQKRTEITQKLQRRDEERLADISKKKYEKESTVAKNESIDLFIATFTEDKNTVELWLSQCDSLEKGKVTDQLDQCLLQIQKMQKYMTDSTMFLTSYDVQKSQEIINQLQNSVSEKREALIPKKKFAFKSKKKAVEKAKEIKAVPKKEVQVQITECNFTDLVGKNLTKSADEINEKDVALARLKDCTVKLYGTPLAVHVNNLTSCKVFTGPVSGSIFVDNCKDCIFVVGCQQLRIHNTTETDFYIHVTSKAIIEDCNAVRFAPYNWSYAGLEDHYKLSGLDLSVNNWNDVDDFNWLASDAHSPNWSVLPEQQRNMTWESN